MVGGVQFLLTKERRQMRATVTTAAVVGLLAAGASPAAARPADSLADYGGPGPRHAAATPSVGVQHRYLGNDAALPTTHSSTAAPAVHVTRTQIADDGIEWADVGIGAGLTAALLLAGAGVVRRQHVPAAH
jgi:hypothetical protein